MGLVGGTKAFAPLHATGDVRCALLVCKATRPSQRAPTRGRSWAYFGLSFGGFGAPTITTTVPTFSAVTSHQFGGGTSGWRGDRAQGQKF
jgi:hypothetical protein